MVLLSIRVHLVVQYLFKVFVRVTSQCGHIAVDTWCSGLLTPYASVFLISALSIVAEEMMTALFPFSLSGSEM